MVTEEKQALRRAVRRQIAAILIHSFHGQPHPQPKVRDEIFQRRLPPS